MRPINIRAIQHYFYCPRRFGLLELNDDWQENSLVVKGNLVHERVHSAEHEYTSTKGYSRSSVQLYNDELEIFGVADCIDFEYNRSAPLSPLLGERVKIKLVEYKPTAPKNEQFSQSDAIQVFAQKVCADSVFGVDCEAYLYYADKRRRVRLPFDTEYSDY